MDEVSRAAISITYLSSRGRDLLARMLFLISQTARSTQILFELFAMHFISTSVRIRRQLLFRALLKPEEAHKSSHIITITFHSAGGFQPITVACADLHIHDSK